MVLYDLYEKYRTPLTEEESLGMPEAEASLARLEAEAALPDSKLKRDGAGFRYDSGEFIPNPVTVEHIGIAMRRAEDQFQGWPAMPEDAGVFIRFPGVDPVGKYSIIDMKVAQRVARIKATLESRSLPVQEYTKSLVNAVRSNREVDRISVNFRETAQKHRVLTRASKLCLDADGRKMLYEQSRMLETNPVVEQLDKYLQGIEFASGVKTGHVPAEVVEFYRNRLQMPLNMERIKEAETVDRTPRRISVEFENLDNKLRQSQFSNPGNWGKTAAEVDLDAIDMGEVEQAVPPYARATADRVIEPLFRSAEALGNGDMALNRGNLIRVDGKTVREKMLEDFEASGCENDEFQAFYQNNLKQTVSEYVAAGLMAGKRVEAFVPDENGHIPAEPVQIIKRGYEPSSTRKVTLNGWERFYSKRGVFKKEMTEVTQHPHIVAAPG